MPCRISHITYINFCIDENHETECFRASPCALFTLGLAACGLVYLADVGWSGGDGGGGGGTTALSAAVSALLAQPRPDRGVSSSLEARGAAVPYRRQWPASEGDAQR